MSAACKRHQQQLSLEDYRQDRIQQIAGVGFVFPQKLGIVPPKAGPRKWKYVGRTDASTQL